MPRTLELFAPVIVALPEGFPIATNPGLHGNMQFFEVTPEIQFTVCATFYEGDTVTYSYESHDSDEGMVHISYQTYGEELDARLHEQGDNDCWDVRITADSDTWGLAEMSAAIAAAVKLHKALGRDKPTRV